MILRFLPGRSQLIVITAALFLFADDSAAQLEFAGVPWGTPAGEVTERIRAAGYTYRGVDQDGDFVFGAADSVDLVAMFDSAGLVHVEATWLRDPDRLPARYGRMGDSLRAVLGAPESVSGADEFESSMTWVRDGARLELFYTPRNGGLDSALVVRHEGPGYQAEDDRRHEASRARAHRERLEGREDTTAVGDYHEAFGGFRVLIRVDTVKYERLGPQAYRARFLHNRMQLRRLPNGLIYTALLTEVELDCRAFRTRLHRMTPLFGSRAVPPIDVPAAERQWTRPPPDSPDDVAVRSACEALGRQP